MHNEGCHCQALSYSADTQSWVRVPSRGAQGDGRVVGRWKHASLRGPEGGFLTQLGRAAFREACGELMTQELRFRQSEQREQKQR